MKFFIDTAEINEIKEAAKLHIIDGVTTNPSLIAKAGRSQEEIIKEICSIVDGPISAEVNAIEANEMVVEGKKLALIHPNVVVKIPMTTEGMKACYQFTQDKIKTNVTLVFSANQALLAAKCGATYVSPFVGRLDDQSHDGMELIKEIKTIFDHYSFNTKILVASIRHPMHVKQAAMLGADVGTLPLKTILQLFQHPLTDHGLKIFLDDYKKSLKK